MTSIVVIFGEQYRETVGIEKPLYRNISIIIISNGDDDVEKIVGQKD